MKTTFFKSVLFTALLAGTFTACVNDEEFPVPDMGCTETTLVATMNAADVPAGSTIQQFTADEVIEAYVTSSDEGGNFFKSISFQTLDGSFAFSVPVDVTSTFVNFEPGRKVFIKLKDLYTDVANGGVRIGAIFANDQGTAAVGRLPESQYRSVLNRSCAIVDENQLVQHVSLLNLQNDTYINKLVEIDNVQFVEASAGDTFYDAANDIGGATNHYITDALGNTMIFRTSSFSNFSGKIVPGESGKIRGVLTKFGDDYQFMARTQRDIMLTEQRFELVAPFFIEDFQSATDGQNLDVAGWINYAELGTKVWKEERFTEDGFNNGYAEFSAFGTGNASNVAWLISPQINFTPTMTQKQIQFRVAQHHLDVDSPENSLQVLISTDFNGTDVLAATWIEVNPNNIPTEETAWYEWLDNAIDVSSYDGPIYVAFKFIGSGTDLTLDGAFQVDNVKALGL